MNKRIAFLLLVVLIFVPRLVTAQVGLTGTPISLCVNDDTDIACVNKLVMNLALSYGVTQQLEAQYIDTVQTQGGTTTSLENPIKIVITKSEPVLNYPLITLDLVAAPRPTLPYQAYMIGAPQRSYTIAAVITQGSTPYSSFSVSPDSPVYSDTTSSHQIVVQLNGESKSSTAPPDLSGYLFFIYKNNMMLVPSGMVPNDGDKDDLEDIGRLLERLLREDTAYLAANPGAQARYLVKDMKMFQGVGATLPSPNHMVLQVLSPDLSYSNLSLQMDSAQVGLVTNEAAAWIKSASANNFNSLSNDGTLAVDIQNVGAVQADYMVSVTNCTPDIVGPIAAQAITLQPQDEYTFHFDLKTTSNTSESHSCTVSLLSPETSMLYDSRSVSFTTNVNNY
jgi:hypothetical protein